MNRNLRFDSARNGMISAIRDAANPHYPDWAPYRGDAIRLAVWWTRRVARMARQQGGMTDDEHT